jgi:hypothetical protein
MGATLGIIARTQLLAFFYKVLHVRHPCYLFSLFHFASPARTRNLVAPAHQTLVMGQSCGMISLYFNSLKNVFLI